MMSTRTWWLLGKIAVSVGLLALLFTRVDVGQAVGELARAAPNWVALAMAATVVAFIVNTCKWQLLFRTLGANPPFLRLLQLNYVGLFYSMVLPGQVGGEVVKGLRLARDGVLPAHSAISIGMDRLTGLVALGALGTVALLLAPATPLRAQFLALGVAIVLMGALLFPLLRRRSGGKPGGFGPYFLPPAVRSFLGSIHGYRAGKSDLALALVYSAAYQALVVASNYLVAVSLGVAVTLPEIGWIVAFVSLINLLPIAFAGLGVREGAYVFLLSQYGVPLSSGLAVALVVLLLLVVQAVVGACCEVFPMRSAAQLPSKASRE